jgi:hypothetical protein
VIILSVVVEVAGWSPRHGGWGPIRAPGIVAGVWKADAALAAG